MKHFVSTSYLNGVNNWSTASGNWLFDRVAAEDTKTINCYKFQSVLKQNGMRDKDSLIR